MADEITTKREVFKGLLGQLRDRAIGEGRGTLANMYCGYIIRTDAGRYDDRLDDLIAEQRAELQA